MKSKIIFSTSRQFDIVGQLPHMYCSGSILARVSASEGMLPLACVSAYGASVASAFRGTSVTYSYSNLLTDQTVKEDTSWSYQLSAWLPWDWTYSATLANGSPLPPWITFNPSNRTFSGTPPLDFSGEIEIEVYARDGSKLVGSDTFKLTITPVNDAPTLKTAIADQIISEDASWSFQVPATTFTDVDSSSLTYTASLANGSALPGWLTFNAATRTFAGKPPQDFNGALELKVTASDGALSTADTFRLTINPVNDAPVVSAAIADQVVAEDTAWTFQVPAGTFSDVDSTSLTYTATLEDGSALPAWLTFNSTTRTFTGTPPANVTGIYNVKVTASDGAATGSDTFRLTINPVNDAPIVATPIADQTVAEDASWAFQVPAGAFTDVDSSLTYKAALASGAALPGWLSFDALSRTFSGTPPKDFNGTIDVRVTASDGLLSVSDTFTLTVSPVNDAPVVATPLANQRVDEDMPWSFKVPAGTFTDVDSASLTYDAALADGSPLPAWLGFNLSTGTFSGTPPKDFSGTINLRVTASDGAATSSTFTLFVNPINDAPVVRAPIGNQSIPEDMAWSFQVPSGAFADVDSSLTYAATLSNGGALPAWLSFDATTRTFSGTPPQDFSGSLALKVTASDGTLNTSSTFTLAIMPTNDAPVVAAPLASQRVAEDTPWTFQVPAVAFTDVDSSSLTYTATLANGQPLPAWLSFDPATRTFAGTPPRDLNGSFDLTVTASDGALSASSTFQLAIDPSNDAPVVTSPIADATILEEAPWTFQVPADTFSDVDSSLTYTATLANSAALPAWLSFDGATRTFSGKPPLNFSGALDLKVSASDGELAISDTFTLNILAVDNPPAVGTPIADQTVAEDTPWLFTLPADAFVDPDSSGLTYTATLVGGAPLPSWLTFDGMTGTFRGTAPEDFAGSIDLKVTAKDDTSEQSSSFRLVIEPVNDAPVAAPIPDQSVVEDTPWSFQVPAGTFSDIDRDALTYTATLSDGSALPDWLRFDAATGTFSGKPLKDATGVMDLTISASDGSLSTSETFRLTITPVNDVPVAGAPILDQSTAEDTSWTFQVPAGAFTDVDSSLTYSATLANGDRLPDWLSFDPATGTFTGTPPKDLDGVLTLTVTASDGSFNLADTFMLTVTSVNDAPVAAPIPDQSITEDTIWTFQVPAGTFSDVDHASLAYTASLSDGSALPDWLKFDGETKTFSGIPPEDVTGPLNLMVTASDGTLDASSTFRLTITPVNDAPVAGTPVADQSVAEEAPWTFQVPADAFTDGDNANLTYTAAMWDGAALPSWITFDPATRTFSGTPPVDYTGSFDVMVTASDGLLSASSTFTLTVTPVNDAPAVAAPIAGQTAVEGAAWSFQVPAATFIDKDGDSLSYTASLADGSALPAWLRFNAATGTFSGTPPLNQPSNLNVMVTASDGTLTASSLFTLAVTPTNDAPVRAVLIADQTVSEETAWSFTVPAGTFTDADSDLTYTATLADGSGLPSWLSFDAPTQTFSGTPPQNFTGNLGLTVVASDGALTASDTFILTVQPVNDAPAVSAPILDQAAAPGSNWWFQVPAGAFSDVDRDGLSYTATLADGTALPSWVTFNGETGTFSGAPPLAQTGSLDFTVTASDGTLTASDTFTLVIKPPASGPVAEGFYDDLIEAGDGNDWIHGGLGNDEMQGEGGNDTIYGGQDNGKILRDLTTGKLTELVIGDNLYGNDGQDTYYYAQGDGIDLIWDFRPGEDIIKVSGFNPQDVKVTFVRGVTNRIATPGHDKLAIFFGNDQGAIVFNDFPGPKAGDVILDFGGGQLTWFDLLSRANTQIGDTVVSPVPAGPSPDPNYTPTGTGAPVELSGGNGNDILSGGEGADRLYGNDGYNWFEGFGGDDQLFGGNAQDVLLGAEGRDRLYGNEGVNWLDGGAGGDELYGGNVQDTLLGGSGNDAIYSNGGDDLVVGGAGSDKLYGTGGTDIIYGDDADGLVFMPPARPVIEPPAPPMPESVVTSTSLTLAPGIMNVRAIGKSSVTLVGNDLDNAMIGNTGKNTLKAGAGNDELNGGYGNDRLYGSTGQDAFVFTTKLGTSTSDRNVNFDTIGDYSVKDDSLRLDNAIFKKLGKVGKLNKAYFTVGEKAKDKNDYVIYDKKTGILSYDADGSGSGRMVEFAKLAKNLKLTSLDFFTI